MAGSDNKKLPGGIILMRGPCKAQSTATNLVVDLRQSMACNI